MRERQPFLVRIDIPDARGVVVRCSSQAVAVRTERDRGDPRTVRQRDGLAIGDVPHAAARVGRRHHAPAGRVECGGVDGSLVVQPHQLLPAARVPHSCHSCRPTR